MKSKCNMHKCMCNSRKFVYYVTESEWLTSVYMLNANKILYKFFGACYKFM